MIQWGATPIGSNATLYLPGVSGSEITRLADRLYSRHSLTLADPHSIATRVTGGVTYVPIPSGTVGDLAGLLTLDLPANVREGQTFRVIVRQVIDGLSTRPRPPAPQLAPRAASRRSAAAAVSRAGTARHVLGTFQFSILVRTRREILPGIERTLANLRRVIGTVPGENRWYPVLLRYLQQVTGRVHALGGGEPQPHPEPPRPHDDSHHDPGEEKIRFEGKVAGIRFDRFGDFEGFVLDTEDGLRDFLSREREVEMLVSKAWRQRIAILVVTERHSEHEPLSIVLLRTPPDE
jgi:hypothetical protein